MASQRPAAQGSPKLERKGYHHGDLRAALKVAALELVREKGTRSLSLNEASRRAGVSVAAPYRHFADKESLLAEIAVDGHSLLKQAIQEAVAKTSSPREQMIEAGLAYLRFAAQHPAYFAVIFQAGINKAAFPELEAAGRETFGTILAPSLALETDPARGLQRALAAWALVHGLATLELEGALAALLPAQPSLGHLRPLLQLFVDC